MAYNNTVILTGNLGSEAQTHDKDGKSFATVSFAKTDSYKNDHGDWIQKDSIWHDVIIFAPKVIAEIKTLKKGARVKVTGSLSYRPFRITLSEGKSITKNEVSVIAAKIELATLVKSS